MSQSQTWADQSGCQEEVHVSEGAAVLIDYRIAEKTPLLDDTRTVSAYARLGGGSSDRCFSSVSGSPPLSATVRHRPSGQWTHQGRRLAPCVSLVAVSWKMGPW